jgi:predicted phosphate transport protein (TIGR00153 family)
VRWFLPKDSGFLDLFSQASANIVQGVTMFKEIVTDPTDVRAKVERLKGYEHEGDRLTHVTLEKLNRSFVTPFDREDIYALITRLDDILDATDAAGNRIMLYRIVEIPEHLVAITDLLLASSREVQKAVLALHDRRKHAEARVSCVEINRLENEADSVHRRALGELFGNATDPLHLIKMKDVYQFIEEATDRCEDVANAVESIIIKSS